MNDPLIRQQGSRDSLALMGGEPMAAGVRPAIWPPRSEHVSEAISALYMSGRWSFNLSGLEARFSEEFARQHNTRFGVLMVNGTVTLQCALAAFGIGPGDEVIVPAHTWLASIMAVAYNGATPVLVDVEPNTLCMDPNAAKEAITDRTRAIMPVHMLGSMADLDALTAISEEFDLVMIEDCAQAHGGVWGDQSVGSVGMVGSFSFQQSKLMTSGEGGICITNDEDITDRMYRLKTIGYGPTDPMGEWSQGPDVGLICHNFRALEFAPLILLDQLASLEEQTLIRETAASRLRDQVAAIEGVRLQAPGRRASRQPYYKLGFVLEGEQFEGIEPTRLIEAFEAEGLPVRAGYGAAHRHPLFSLPPGQYRVHNSVTPVAERVAGTQMVTLGHEYLACSESDLECIAATFAKVSLRASDLR